MNSHFPESNNPIKFYRFEASGHCHRVQLMTSLLDLPYEIIELNRDGSNRPDDYLETSPFGQVPVIDDNGVKLADSNAILVYLVKKYKDGHAWLPESAEQAARTQRWLSIAAGELASGPAAARFSNLYKVEIDFEAVEKKTHALLGMINNTLSQHDFLIGDEITIADIACYTYVAHAPEGDISLESYANIKAWLAKIEAMPRFVAMKKS
ncbi:glutathione S-transferase family protein [Cocleimonas flava]|uniref:Glutathione S-transferase n=1 Tax=Cocleimonas flava TaxID=634765 RepID=A0A4R1EZQ7_9GAMM|nr:glutathione S-transferase [Cocleimonas flava]TCJ87387.1 glutathione S-transferase [Cocleimonas flava]